MDYSRVFSLVRATRFISLPLHGKATKLRSKSELAHDIVTTADVEIEHMLKAGLAEIDPTITFSGEEFGGDTTQKFWLCDPIDGTAHFVRGLPFSTTMLALIEDGEVIFSVIYDFVTDTLYHAEKGKGAFKNGERIFVSNRVLKDAYLIVESNLTKSDANKKLFLSLDEKIILMSTICCGWEFAMVAEGKIDGRIMFDPFGHEWDFAPGALLVQEAGGKVANIGSRTYDYRNLNFLATNKEVYEELTEGDNPFFPLT